MRLSTCTSFWKDLIIIHITNFNISDVDNLYVVFILAFICNMIYHNGGDEVFGMHVQEYLN